jgi:hypothetical protein
MQAIRRIPPAPRQARWGAVLWFRWPLAVVFVLAGVVGGLASVMLSMATSKRAHDAELDRGPCHIVAGTVVATRETRVRLADESAVFATFTFRPADADAVAADHKASCFAPASLCVAPEGATATIHVEYLPDEPDVARIVGGRLTLQPDLWTPWFVLVVVPGLAAGALWAFGVLRLRGVLRDADITLADEYEIRRGVWSVPETLEVRFWFRDYRARRMTGRHWLRVRSAAGQELTSDRPPKRLLVAHDRRHPERWHRVVHPDDFVTTETTSPELADTPS